VGPRASLDDVEKRKLFILQDSKPDPLLIQPVASRYTDYTLLVAVSISRAEKRQSQLMNSYVELNRGAQQHSPTDSRPAIEMFPTHSYPFVVSEGPFKNRL
jgi:hypothetical protein